MKKLTNLADLFPGVVEGKEFYFDSELEVSDKLTAAMLEEGSALPQKSSSTRQLGDVVHGLIGMKLSYEQIVGILHNNIDSSTSLKDKIVVKAEQFALLLAKLYETCPDGFFAKSERYELDYQLTSINADFPNDALQFVLQQTGRGLDLVCNRRNYTNSDNSDGFRFVRFTVQESRYHRIPSRVASFINVDRYDFKTYFGNHNPGDLGAFMVWYASTEEEPGDPNNRIKHDAMRYMRDFLHATLGESLGVVGAFPVVEAKYLPRNE